MKITTTLVTLAFVAASSVSAQFTNFISGTSGPVQYDGTNFTVTPSPLCIGKEYCLTASGTLSTDIIEGATYTVSGRFAQRLVYTERNKDLCALLAASGTPCPVPAGAFNLNACLVGNPNIPPNWALEFEFMGVNGDGGNIFVQQTPGYFHTASGPALKAIFCP